jgi:hypothetical protein
MDSNPPLRGADFTGNRKVDFLLTRREARVVVFEPPACPV